MTIQPLPVPTRIFGGEGLISYASRHAARNGTTVEEIERPLHETKAIPKPSHRRTRERLQAWRDLGALHESAFATTEFNKARHVQDADMGPEKRAFTLEELQAFFDLADLEVERIINSGRKGALAAWRDAVAFKTGYGWGLRRDELRHLGLVDFSRNVKAPYSPTGVTHLCPTCSRSIRAASAVRHGRTSAAHRSRTGSSWSKGAPEIRM